MFPTEWLLLVEAALSLAAVLVIAARQHDPRAPGVGLVLAYALSLWLIHWPGAVLYVLPWYTSYLAGVVETGFRESTYALVAFAFGSVFVGPRLMRRWSNSPIAAPAVRLPVGRLEVVYALWGFLSYLVLVPLVGQAPTTTAIVVAGWSMLAVGLGLACWRAWQERQQALFVALLLVAACLPLLTIVSQGYLGYGAGALLAVLALVNTFHRWPRRRMIAVVLVGGYVALSFYGSYMRDRSEIRASVWGGDTLGNRVERLYEMVSDFEWFDPYDNVDLSRVDDRLNQNVLVGTAVDHLDSQLADFALGETLWQSVLALVPRALWPSKPVVAGSMDLVSRYTGLSFQEGTSVGIGQVMELYVNFGTPGIVLWFIAVGAFLRMVDAVARRRLTSGDWPRFALWYMPALCALQVGWSMADITATAGAAAVNVLFVNHVVVPLVYRPSARGGAGAAGRSPAVGGAEPIGPMGASRRG